MESLNYSQLNFPYYWGGVIAKLADAQRLYDRTLASKIILGDEMPCLETMVKDCFKDIDNVVTKQSKLFGAYFNRSIAFKKWKQDVEFLLDYFIDKECCDLPINLGLLPINDKLFKYDTERII